MTQGIEEAAPDPLVIEALRLLDVRRFLLCIHDASFPSDPGEDTGWGSPYTRGGEGFLAFARSLGFGGVQLGPQGATQPDDASPYRGAAFPRSPLAISLARLAHDEEWGGLLAQERLEEIAEALPTLGDAHVPYAHARRVQERALASCFAVHRERLARGHDPRGRAAELEERRTRFEATHAHWLERYETFELLASLNGTRDRRRWRTDGEACLDGRLWNPGASEAAACSARLVSLRASAEEPIASYRFVQLLAHEQHRSLHMRAHAAGFSLFGDLPIGLSAEDEWCYGGVLMRDYRMGAPPSRTNPEGQPWDFALLDPDQYEGPDGPGPSLRFFGDRVDAMCAHYDGIRVDHPHGLVSPWVYRAEAADPEAAVRSGARLFCSPAEPEHPALMRLAIARPEQLAVGVARYADDRVRALEPDQVDRYARLFDVVVDHARRHGLCDDDIACEVLSTLPFPVAQVLARHRLGRFRVTQKRVLGDPNDPYRPEAAQPEDWVMVGTHDTPTLWECIAGWERNGSLGVHARRLAAALAPAEAQRSALAARLAADPGLLAQAFFAELFASPARHVSVFFADLLGMTERYNAPGAATASNWTLRAPRAYAALHQERSRRRLALSIPLALALALRARRATLGQRASALAEALESLSQHGACPAQAIGSPP